MIGNPKSKIRNLCFIILMIMGVLVWVLRCGDIVTAGPYLDSAHGNTSYGVDRSGIDAQYSTFSEGNCSHCHEKHTSLGGTEPDPTYPIGGAQKWLLMSKFWDPSQSCGEQSFCYDCHSFIHPAPSQVENYSYAYLFGGASTQYWWDIKRTFCKAVTCVSRHNLSSIESFIDSNAFSWGYPDNANPCCACHNVHKAQRIGSKQSGNYNPSKSPISRPSAHDNLWGDDAPGERMSQYASSVGGVYQAPFYGDTSGTKFEPSGNASPSDGTDLPDYTTLCLDCHAKPGMESQFGITRIDWSSHKHGGRAADPHSKGSLGPPYSDRANWENTNFVLSCTDCHEPHAGKNKSYMLRGFVNGQAVAAEPISPFTVCWAESTGTAVPYYFEDFCMKCHATHHADGNCRTCHNHAEGTYGANWWGYTF